jgi:hypothetical protein
MEGEECNGAGSKPQAGCGLPASGAGLLALALLVCAYSCLFGAV